jgi:hypothetical protein
MQQESTVLKHAVSCILHQAATNPPQSGLWRTTATGSRPELGLAQSSPDRRPSKARLNGRFRVASLASWLTSISLKPTLLLID